LSFDILSFGILSFNILSFNILSFNILSFGILSFDFDTNNVASSYETPIMILWTVFIFLFRRFILFRQFKCFSQNPNESLRRIWKWKQGFQMVYFQTQNPNLGKLLEGIRLENVDKFYGYLE
jgi:hypothetical protein